MQVFYCLLTDLRPSPPKVSEMRVWPLSTSVEVSWKPPDHGTVRGYQVGYGISIPDVYKVNVNASVLHYIIQNLGQSMDDCSKIILCILSLSHTPFPLLPPCLSLSPPSPNPCVCHAYFFTLFLWLMVCCLLYFVFVCLLFLCFWMVLFVHFLLVFWFAIIVLIVEKFIFLNIQIVCLNSCPLHPLSPFPHTSEKSEVEVICDKYFSAHFCWCWTFAPILLLYCKAFVCSLLVCSSSTEWVLNHVHRAWAGVHCECASKEQSRTWKSSVRDRQNWQWQR